MLAISYGTATRAIRLGILDVATGAVRAEQALSPATDRVPDRMRRTWGMAWSDAATVRVVWAELPPDANRVYRVDEVMKVVEVPVQ
jgi:hypothetical protein